MNINEKQKHTILFAFPPQFYISMHFECKDDPKSQDKLQAMLMQKFVGETKSTMTIKVVLNKAYYSAHFHHHANLYVISIYLVVHFHPSQVCNKMTK